MPLARRLHDLPWQRRRRCVAVPLALLLQAREIVAQRLLVEARLAPARCVAIGRPEPGGVGRENLVDHEQATVGRAAELELRIGEDDAPGPRAGAPPPVQAPTPPLEPAR